MGCNGDYIKKKTHPFQIVNEVQRYIDNLSPNCLQDLTDDWVLSRYSISAPYFISTIDDSSSPFIVYSSGIVENLNADYLDGYHAQDIIDMISGVSLSGVLLSDGSIPLTNNWNAGNYNITANSFISTQNTGSAPLTVLSSTMVENLNADMVDGQHADGISRTIARLDDDNDFGGHSITANTFYGDGSNLTGIDKLYYSTILFPEYKDCIMYAGINEMVDIDLETPNLGHNNYYIIGHPNSSGLQHMDINIKEYIPYGFTEWENAAIQIEFLTNITIVGNNHINVRIGKIDEASYHYEIENVVSDVGDTWGWLTINAGDLLNGINNYFIPEDILNLKIEVYTDKDNYIKLGMIKFNYKK